MEQEYILGLDLGTNSIGWACINEKTNKIIKAGVRIFDRAEQPKTGKSLAEPRRTARLTRRRLHRRRVRLNNILTLLLKSGFIRDKKSLQTPYTGNMWELRVKALYNKLSNEDLAGVIYHISKLRNERIEFTKRTYAVDEMMYHCVTREYNKVNLYELPMDIIDIDSVKLKKATDSSISFNDRYNEYSFNISKSTLLKRFMVNYNNISIPVQILEDPIELLLKLHDSKFAVSDEQYEESILLPLYSVIKGVKTVPEKSGLNQWNAGGRKRNPNEIYIPISSWIHK